MANWQNRRAQVALFIGLALLLVTTTARSESARGEKKQAEIKQYRGQREYDAAKGGHWASTFNLPTLTASDQQNLVDRCLMIISPDIVDDARARGLGPWSCGALMSEIANEPATGISPVDFTKAWLAGLKAHVGSTALDAWSQASGGPDKLTMDKLPFRLLAIINRIDLRNNIVLGGSGAGELRFVFGVIDKNGAKIEATVIFEFAVKRSTFNEVRAWGRQWYQLRNLDPTTPAYKAALQQLTDQYTLRNADVDAPPNCSAVSQIRVNNIDGPSSKNWSFSEFRVDAQNTGMLVQVTVKQTPKLDFNKSDLLTEFLNDYRDAILGDRHVVPIKYKTQDFLETSASFSSERPPKEYWYGNKLPTDLQEARHRFALNTCSGCHTRETNANFFHVFPRESGKAAELSPFLKGVSVEDPDKQKDEADPTKIKVRRFDDLARRAEDLRLLVEVGRLYESTRVPVNATH